MARSNRSKQVVTRSLNLSPNRALTNLLLRPPGPTPAVTRHSNFVEDNWTNPFLDDLRQVEDRRTFHPLRSLRPVRSLLGTPPRVVLRDKRSKGPKARGVFSSQTKAILAFEEPKAVLVCVRRQRRKEVLHALKKAGRGGGKRKRKRSWHSSISCR